MLEFLLLLFCCRSGTLSNALWGRGRLLIPTRALPGIAGRRGDAGPACFPQMLCEHPLGLSPSCLHVCLSFLERLVKVSDKSTCQMLGSRPPHQCWTELPKTQISPGPSLLLKTLPWLLDIPWAKTHTPARACLIRSPPPCPPPLTSASPSPNSIPCLGLNPQLGTPRRPESPLRAFVHAVPSAQTPSLLQLPGQLLLIFQHSPPASGSLGSMSPGAPPRPRPSVCSSVLSGPPTSPPSYSSSFRLILCACLPLTDSSSPRKSPVHPFRSPRVWLTVAAQ